MPIRLPTKLPTYQQCDKPDCTEQVKAKGLCEKHYYNEYRKLNKGYCANQTCNRYAVMRKGLCEYCYKLELHSQKTGIVTVQRTICKVEECEALVHSKELCSTHYKYLHSHGEGQCKNPDCEHESILYKGECVRCINRKRKQSADIINSQCAIKSCNRLRVDIEEGQTNHKLCSIHLDKMKNGTLLFCKISECGRPQYAHAFCYNHYSQYLRWQRGKGGHPEELTHCAILNCIEPRKHKNYCIEHGRIYLTEHYRTHGVKCIVDECSNITQKHRRGMCQVCYDIWRKRGDNLKREDFEHWRKQQMIARPNKLFLNVNDETPENEVYAKIVIAFLDSKGFNTSERLHLSA